MPPLNDKLTRGSVLLIVLWMVILIGFVGLAFSFSVRTQVQVTANSRGKTEAYWAARAGIEKARAMLMTIDPALLTDADPIFNDEEVFSNQPIGTGVFTIAPPPVLPDDELRFGILDEASRVNINLASRETLLLLPGMTEEMADSLIDWRDEDIFPQPLGAEDDYYLMLEDPYPPRNGNFASVMELMRVRGWAPIFHAAYPDPYTAYLSEELQPPKADPEIARLLLASLTTWSADRGLAPDGEAKLVLADASENQMRRRIPNLSRDEARAIAQYREDNEFRAVTDLLDVTAVQENANNTRGQSSRTRRSSTNSNRDRRSGNDRNSGGRSGGGGNDGGSQQNQPRSSSGSPNQNPSGGSTQTQTSTRKIFDLRRASEIIDYFTVEENESGSETDPPGRVNINTAPFDVLLSIPGMTEDMANEILNQRGQGVIEAAGAIAQLPGMDDSTFRQIYPTVMTSSNRFRIVSHGTDIEGKTRVTIEAVLSIEDDGIDVVYWRER